MRNNNDHSYLEELIKFNQKMKVKNKDEEITIFRKRNKQLQ